MADGSSQGATGHDMDYYADDLATLTTHLDLKNAVKTPANPGGLPKSVFDDLQRQLAVNRSQFYFDLASLG